ncbi:unnamed protein product [Allacma fusca]|uniref:Innexin n=1 Tax=Allacma fusca TaxID=39272 RepID=A0A8J2K6B3_9HEXA|nr:unnamed protein product [Allacma fusca]
MNGFFREFVSKTIKMNRLIDSVKRFFKKPDIVTSNWTFWFHSVVTTSALVVFCTVLAIRELVGEPIQCITSCNCDQNYVNRFCWMSTTFTMPDAFNRPPPGAVAYPGVVNNFGNVDGQKHYVYYQWVVMVMAFQAMLCYLPKKIWRWWESGLMRQLLMDHPGWKSSLCKCNDEAKAKRKANQIDYILKHLNTHNWYALCYWFTELMCFVNVVVQIFLMNLFFKGDFIKYGLTVVTFPELEPNERSDNMAFVFPHQTKCTFHRYGPGGSIERIDALCILPLNVTNEKTYICLWFWYFIMAAATGIVVVSRIVSAFFPKYRRLVISFADPAVQRAMTEDLSIGDWWVLYMLGKNLEPQYYAKILSEVAHKKREMDGCLKVYQLV